MTDIVRRRGDTYADEFIIKSATTGQPIPIAGYQFKLTVDPEAAPANADNNLFQVDGQIIDALNGRVEFPPLADQVDHVGSYFYDVQMIDGAGRKRTVVAGKYKLVQDITKV